MWLAGRLAGRPAPVVYMLVCSEFGPFCDIPGTDLLLQPRRQAMYSLRISDSVCERVSAGVGESSACETETSSCKILSGGFYNALVIISLADYVTYLAELRNNSCHGFCSVKLLFWINIILKGNTLYAKGNFLLN
jgi:hypothetical protein